MFDLNTAGTLGKRPSRRRGGASGPDGWRNKLSGVTDTGGVNGDHWKAKIK